MSIAFPYKPAIYTPNNTVAFAAQINGVDVTCEISTEALKDHFGATSNHGADLVSTFETNRVAIESVARTLLPQRITTGRCLLVTMDFYTKSR